MIKQVTLRTWKSFEEATLYIDPLTIMIGANASGKSNVIDALCFLQRLAMGRDMTQAIAGEPGMPEIRGGLEWCVLKPYRNFTLELLIEGNESYIDYEYTITCGIPPGIDGRCELENETLKRIKYRQGTKKVSSKNNLFNTDHVAPEKPGITVRLYNQKGGKKIELNRFSSILSQLYSMSLRKEIEEGIKVVSDNLRNIFILDPVTSHMRSYSALSEHLRSDAMNIAGVLAGLPNDKKVVIENTLTDYIKHIPEKDIVRVWAEAVGKFNSDAMLYCEEKWRDDAGSETIDAKTMSDGTLRFLAVLTALLIRPENSLLVVEEIDNGLHPSRAELLLKMLKEVGGQRRIDILATTHNPALLDALEPELMPFVVVAHRDAGSGYSRLSLLEDISDMAKLLAGGSLGNLSRTGKLLKALNRGIRHNEKESNSY